MSFTVGRRGRSCNRWRLVCCELSRINPFFFFVKELFKLVLESVHFLVLLSPSNDIFPMQTVFENSLMQHHVALPPDAMGKITFIASPGQYSLKVCLSNFFSMESIIIVKIDLF